MSLQNLLDQVQNKKNFISLDDYATFCYQYLSFIANGLQAVIISKNEYNYCFFQYKQDGGFAITRPINRDLMLSLEEFESARKTFHEILPHIRDLKNEFEIRNTINRFVYTCQQSIGATLDALPAGKSNQARKINGDLFERYIRRILFDMGLGVREGTVSLPVAIDDKVQFHMKYQHDLIIEKDGILKAIGSVKTSSKDRLDKVFIDKFLYNRLVGIDVPHFAVFLHDIQRKGREPNYGVNTTFLTNRYKGYTVRLNPLDGVYYCDMRPIMREDSLLQQTIKTLDYLLVEDVWEF